mmetsp:Transcript_25012/g.50899  ORF Transcript_25012/g.50899 Transcript_25012/m.50899 type:complete len:363 (+) Transcript_25012:609-1697(+)
MRHRDRLRMRPRGQRRRHGQGRQEDGEKNPQGRRQEGRRHRPLRIQGPDRGERGGHGEGSKSRKRQAHPDHAPRFQPNVPNQRRGHVRRLLRRVPSSRDRPGHIHQFQKRPWHLPLQDPLRHRSDRQGVPQRNHPPQFHIPFQGIRTDGGGILHPPGGGGGMEAVPREVDGRIQEIFDRRGFEGGSDGLGRARGGRTGALRPGVHGRDVPISVRGAGVDGNRGEGELRSDAAHGGERKGPRLLRRSNQGKVHPPLHRTLPRRRSSHPRPHLLRLRRGRSLRRKALLPQIPPLRRPREGQRPAPGQEQAGPRGGRKGPVRQIAEEVERPVGRDRRHRQEVQEGRRGGDSLLHHGGFRHHRNGR